MQPPPRAPRCYRRPERAARTRNWGSTTSSLFAAFSRYRMFVPSRLGADCWVSRDGPARRRDTAASRRSVAADPTLATDRVSRRQQIRLKIDPALSRTTAGTPRSRSSGGNHPDLPTADHPVRGDPAKADEEEPAACPPRPEKGTTDMNTPPSATPQEVSAVSVVTGNQR